MYIVVCLDRKLKPSKYVAWYFAGHVFLSPDTRTLHLFDGVDILLAPGTPGDPVRQQVPNQGESEEQVEWTPLKKNYFTSCDPHHDIYTFSYWQIFWHSI